MFSVFYDDTREEPVNGHGRRTKKAKARECSTLSLPESLSSAVKLTHHTTVASASVAAAE